MATHIWSIITHKESLWVRWIHSYKLKGRCFWDVPLRSGISWGWRKLLQIRDTIRPFIWYRLGNGTKAFVWFDRWCNECPLSRLKSVRKITNRGFTMNDKVVDVIQNGEWRWQSDWINIQPPLLDPNKDDTLFWRDINGDFNPFSVSRVWDSIRPRNDAVPWVNIVWFSQCIPRHAFHMWLVMLGKLKTQDVLRQWDVWFLMRRYAGMDNVDAKLVNILAWLHPLSSKYSARSICARLVVAASSYFIWQERNNRIFKNKSRTVEQVHDIIIANVRLKLISLRFKKSVKVAKMLEIWKITNDNND